ncbi:uncharacterized protein [Misgurnus anguillicaudatus]|uniref:uncharacterized protein n=1 Tax=Misgurnus anguillicaudatus TaxID=75329 RepID=UPI003CCF2037
MSHKLDKAKMEADLEVLQHEKEQAAALAQAEVLEAAVAAIEDSISSASFSVSSHSKVERTKDYVEMQNGVELNKPKETDIQNSNCSNKLFPETSDPNCSAHSLIKMNSEQDAFTELPSQPLDLSFRDEVKQEIYNPHASCFSQRTPIPGWSHSAPFHQPESSGMLDLAKYLARRELVNTSLVKFDDRPESFRAWKSAFVGATDGLGLTAGKELDLLIRWLGKESSDHVKRLRSVYVSDPKAALHDAWERLTECYGAPEIIENALLQRLENFPRVLNKDFIKLRELGDLLTELQAAKQDGYLPGLTYLDTARGLNPIVEKLPYFLQEKWLSHGMKYKEQYNATFPPFWYFVNFVCYEAKARNDPSFMTAGPPKSEKFLSKQAQRMPISVHKIDVSQKAYPSKDSSTSDENPKLCPIHNKPHPLKKCRGFRMKPMEERKAYLKEHGICFRCCASSSHIARNCKVAVKCMECDSEDHNTALHPGPAPWVSKSSSDHGGEEKERSTPPVNSACTKVCGEGLPAKSCSKICLVRVYPKGRPEAAVKMYAMLDDQSNRSLVRSEFFEFFSINSQTSPYLLKTCAGTIEASGRRANGFQIEPVSGNISLTLPTRIECNNIPDNRAEIPTPEVAQNHPHLRRIASEIPEMDDSAQILMLLGRDALRVHKVRRQINGPHNDPFAIKTDLGWLIIGDVCLGNSHKPSVLSCKTHVLDNGRTSYFPPCQSHINLKDSLCLTAEAQGIPHIYKGACASRENLLGCSVFKRTRDDDKPALSVEDHIFLEIMDNEFFRDSDNSWVGPLPFRHPRPLLPNNREHALTRLYSLRWTLLKRPEMNQQFTDFMQRLFENDHAEYAAPLSIDQERWYLPYFGVYHPKKPNQIRVVFDSSSQYQGLSLNSILLTGPDLNNSLLGVLIRFRKELVAVTADIQQMFHCFTVREDHRYYLRFLWFRDHDLEKDVIECRMKVHVFGNSPSPAVAIYGLHRAAKEGELMHGTDTYNFVKRDFYVDDGLRSFPTAAEAVDLLRRTQASLAESNLRLHKIMSNSPLVLAAFPPEDCAKGVKDLDFGDETIPAQRSLGLNWEISTDTFTFHSPDNSKPLTRRGILSTVNSLYDPLGFAAPVTIHGRFLLRELSKGIENWDEPLPEEKCREWEMWRNSLQDLERVHVQRTYSLKSLSKAKFKELCIFSDASFKAIGAVAYLRIIHEDGQINIGFVLGKAKLTPPDEPTIPRLELCAAVLAVEISDLILDEIDFEPDSVKFFCDSKVVLGYIHNESRRFYVYVHNRVQRIRQSSKAEQWHYVPTEHNPADCASRSVPASLLTHSMWLTGPDFLSKPTESELTLQENFELVNPETDSEVRPLP